MLEDLVISEVMFNPASPEDDWEWIELTNTGSTAVDLAGTVIDDGNSVAHSSANIAAGTIEAGQSAILFNADDITAADFEAAWGSGITLIAVTQWGNMGLNNSGDTIGFWDSFASYTGDNQTQANALFSITYPNIDDGAASVTLTDLANPSSFTLSQNGVNGAITSQVNGTTNAGSDVGSPGTFNAAPPPPPPAELTIPEIQGAGHVSAFDGTAARTQGIVTAIAFNGFYIQDIAGDGDDETSDGIFVSGSTAGLAVGDIVQVDGQVTEVVARSGELSTTTLNATSISVQSSGNALPTAVVIGASGRVQPNETVISAGEQPVDLSTSPGTFNPTVDAIDFYEALEGMLVTLEDTVAVAPTRVFSQFSAETVGLANQGAGVDADDVRTINGGISLQSGLDNTGDQNPERVNIQFDQTISGEAVPPKVNVGDLLGDVTGVMGYSFGNFEINVTGPLTVTPGTTAQETTSLTGDADTVTVASYNILNVSADGSDAAQIDRLASQIVNNLGAPDVIALQEVQDNNGTATGELNADQTLQAIVDAIALAGGPAYQFLDAPPPSENAFGGQPGGNIRNAYLYNSDRVTLKDSVQLDQAELTSAGVSDPTAFAGSRDPLLATFTFNGEDFTVINNHFSSRFGSTPIFGAQQPFVQAGEAARAAQSQAVNDYVDVLLATDPDAKISVVGDLNTFNFTDEISQILPGVGPEKVLNNLIDTLPTADQYTFNFEGNSQVLDHFLVTDNLASAAQVDIVHVNKDFFRDDNQAQFTDSVVASDHEPIVATLDVGTSAPTNFTLQILHASDLEGGVDAIGRAANFAAIVDALEEEVENTIILSAGDNYLPGPFFSAGGDSSVRSALEQAYLELFGQLGDPSVPGTFDFDIREGSGRIDIAIMNLIGFDASAVGNHEFDLGSDTFEGIIEEDIRDAFGSDGLSDEIRAFGAQFPYLSANLDFTGDGDLANLFTPDILANTAFGTSQAEFQAVLDAIASGDPAQIDAALDVISAKPKIAPATIIEEGGEQIGVVGATTQLLETISSPTGTTVVNPDGVTRNDMAELAAILQPTIDALLNQGINKVVLVSHLQQFSLEQELIGLLSGVDVIIAGGSDTRLSDGNDVLRPGDTSDGDYPFFTTNADGDTAVVVSTDGEYSYVGRLVLEFDTAGKIISPTAVETSGDANVNGAFATTDDVVNQLYSDLGLGDPFAEGTKGAQVKALTDAVNDVVAARDGTVFGETTVFLDGRRSEVRTEETNAGNLTADANLAAAKDVDPTVMVSIKNGGGIRAPIGEVDPDGTLLPPQANPISGKLEGEISQLDIENILRFNNGLTLQTLTAEQLKIVLEHAVSSTDTDGGATPGQFFQIGGISLSFDESQQAQVLNDDGTVAVEGQRIQSAAILDDQGEIIDVLVINGELAGDADRAIRIVTLDFLANGGDGYPYAAFAAADPVFANRVDLTSSDPATGAATFAPDGTEQDALAEFLAANHGIGAGTPFDAAEQDRADDERIQQTRFRNDTVLASVLASAILGDDGDNRLNGGFGDDQFFAFDGNDRINAGFGEDTIDGGAGNDVINAGFGDDEAHGGAGNDVINAGFGDDTVSGGAGNDRVNGGSGDDVINGNAGNDRLNGGFGDDTIDGGTGNDRINGGFGDDTLTGGEGDDTINGGFGDDIINGGAGNDVLRGGFGNDTIDGGAGNDTILGGRGNDILLGGAGEDTIRGNSGNDQIDGGLDDDRLFGNSGNDVLDGGAGDDELFGGSGNDVLNGGTGNDLLNGGSGADILVFAADSGFDTVTGFQNGTDQIDVSAVFADFAQVQGALVDEGADTRIVFDAAGGDEALFVGVTIAQLDGGDFIFGP